jgi:LysR family nitrogen assimilation transcriptional regulator
LGSLTRAALFLDSSQSLLSRHLNALERECNARLFSRTGLGVQLSEVGQRLFPHVKALLCDAEQLELEIRGEAREPTGRRGGGERPEEFGPFIFAQSARWGAPTRAVGARLD